MFLILCAPVCLLFWLCQRANVVSSLVLSESKSGWAIALSTCVLAPGEILVLLLIPLMTLPSVCYFRGAALFTGAALSFQMVFPVIPAWPSVPYTSAASEQRCFPVGILGCCNTKVLLEGYWSSKLCSFLSAMSVTSPELNNYVCFMFFLLVSNSFFHYVFWFSPDFFLSVSLGFSHFPSPSVEPSEGQRFLAQPSCFGILWDVSASEDLGRVWCSWLRA